GVDGDGAGAMGGATGAFSGRSNPGDRDGGAAGTMGGSMGAGGNSILGGGRTMILEPSSSRVSSKMSKGSGRAREAVRDGGSSMISGETGGSEGSDRWRRA